jgi:hypothetical protein
VNDLRHTEKHVLCIKVGYDDLVLDLEDLFESLEVGGGYQSRMRTERFFRSHLLVDIREMVESPHGGRESPDERPERKSEEGDVEHILRSRPPLATVICDGHGISVIIN